jgi:CPA2 family monovalent cation:H+ antiporter-2
VLPVALLLLVLTSVTKVATGWWTAKRAGVARRGRMRAGTVLIARGEFSIVIAGLAIGSGLDRDLVPLAATYVLLTAIVGPVLTRFADSLANLGAPRPPAPPAVAPSPPPP